MDPSIEAVRPHVEMLCRRLGIRRLDVVDSDGSGDVDLVVDLGSARDDRLDVHAALKRGIEQMLGQPVRLVEDTGDGPKHRCEPVYRAGQPGTG